MLILLSLQSTPIDPKLGHSVHEGTDYLEKPRFLQAITENNSPRYDWGPKKSANHYGLYLHLRKKPVEKNNISIKDENEPIHSNGFVNDQYERDEDQLENFRETRF